ncbi:N-acetylmuramic acid 6-phosphate etherase [Armatimonas sp.]|uniref:N-acetylmuramic acid 6-phosphate etherase n=1 Tax=Armatimonas sp. TaxID=1872638 RepID=UPI00286A870D|nr:N-acetylmuramic acid 6-phosphate etherase [Armatimonas sp.]
MNTLPSTELVNPHTDGIDRLPTDEMLRRINDEDEKVAGIVRGCIPEIARAVDAIAEGLRAGGRLIYVGAGTSGRLGVLDASECLPTFGVSVEQVFGIIAGGERALTKAIEGAEDDRQAGSDVMDSVYVGKHDVIVGMSASGGAPYVRGAIARAKELGAITVGVACATPAPLCDDADIPIQAVVGAEVLQGSTRLKSGTAQKLICNMLSTGAMVKIGKTLGNRMVDVQATNIKLVARATRLIADLGQTDETTAARLLTESGGSAKVGIVMARKDVDASTARELLAAAGGFLGVVLDVTPV